MRIVIAHNRYKFAGGEDSVVESEVAMLRRAGHEVRLLEADNRAIEGPLRTIAAAGALFHSAESARRMQSLIGECRPQVLHVHNWFPLLSPSIHLAAARAGVPVVQTLHNFRMVCANSALYRDGHICHRCLGKALPSGAVVHGCYKESRAGSALLTAAFALHRAAHTWESVSTFIALSNFQRDLLVRGGMDTAEITIKPNFVPDHGVGDGSGGFALFAGRLTPEKGIRTLLRAWESNADLPPLRIMGDGPLAGEVRARASRAPRVHYLGAQPREMVAQAMHAAAFLVFPSLCYEALPLAVLEAFSHGVPVLAAELPSTTELVADGETGLYFRAGDAADLCATAARMTSHPPLYAAMRANCRREYQRLYSEQINYRQLMDIYGKAIAERSGQTPSAETVCEACA